MSPFLKTGSGKSTATRCRGTTNLTTGIQEGRAVPCGPEAALPQVVCVNGLQEAGEILPFPADLVKPRTDSRGEKIGVYVAGLAQDLLGAYAEWKLPSELGLAWARPGKTKYFHHAFREEGR